MSKRARSVNANVVLASLIILTAAGASTPVWAQKAITSAVPATPASVNPSNTQVTSGAACAQQLDDHLVNLAQISQDLAIAQTSADAAGLLSEGLGELGQPFSNGATAAGVVAQGAALGIGIGDLVNQQNQINLENTANNLPSCDQAFTGTISVSAGGANIAGDSIFQDDLGVVGDIQTSGGVGFANGIAIAGPAGTTATVGADSAIAIGGDATASAANSVAIGSESTAGEEGAIAVGNGATASAEEAVAVGDTASASGAEAVAVGSDATASNANSAAFGNNASTTRDNQQVFGNSTNTYTTPGITSLASRAAQAGPLELASTDAAGNLASDGGQIANAITENRAGIALAMAMQAPDLAGKENFGLRLNYGAFDGDANAFTINSAGVIGRDLIMPHDRISIDVGFGAGFSSGLGRFSDSEDDVYAGRAGVQWTW